MLFSKRVLFSAIAAFAIGTKQALGHGLITAAIGANGVTTGGFANDPSVCRNSGSLRCEGDTVVFQRGGGGLGLGGLGGVLGKRALFSGGGNGAASPGCGRTQLAGQLNCATELAKMEQQVSASDGGLPSVAGAPNGAGGGAVTMTIHQVNQDGAGPYKMFVNTDGTGQQWQAMTVTQNVPGTFGISGTTATDFQVSGQLPAGTTCTGGQDGQTCLVRAQNPIGPFGGVAAFTQAQAQNATRRSTDTVEKRIVASKSIAGRLHVLLAEAA